MPSTPVRRHNQTTPNPGAHRMALNLSSFEVGSRLYPPRLRTALRQRRLGRSRAIENHLLQDREVFEIAPASQGRNSVESLRPIPVRTLGKAYQVGLLQNLKVTVQIAVRQCAELFHFRERQPFRVCDQASQHA